MIFGKKQSQRDDDDDDDEDEEEEELNLVTFMGAINGVSPDFSANAKLVQAGLGRAKELVTDALSRRAEMIRLEPKGQAAVATFFVDGIPYPAARMPAQAGMAITQVMKLLAGLDVRERTKPQSGGLKATFEELPYELKVDSAPLKEGGERMVVRARNTKVRMETPDDLGFGDTLKNKIRDMTCQQKGIVLAAGPPMSGVSTLAFAILRGVDAYIYTVYSMFDLQRDMAHISQFKGEPGDDFLKTITRAKRAEANVLYFEAIKSAEQAKLILDQADNVCIVSEIPARDASDAIARFRNHTGDPSLTAERLLGVFCQKLVRLLCDKCRQAYRPNPKLLQRVGLPPETKVLYRAYQFDPDEAEDDEEEPETCEKCGGVGYFGRAAMVELVEVTEGVRAVIAAGSDAVAIKAQARKEKMQSFQSDGLRLVAAGKTSLEELQRVFKSDTAPG